MKRGRVLCFDFGSVGETSERVRYESMKDFLRARNRWGYFGSREGRRPRGVVVGLCFIYTRPCDLGLERRLIACIGRGIGRIVDRVIGEGCVREGGVDERLRLVEVELAHEWGVRAGETAGRRVYITFGAGERCDSCEDRVEPRPWHMNQTSPQKDDERRKSSDRSTFINGHPGTKML